MKSGRNGRIRVTHDFVILIVEISKPSYILCQVTRLHKRVVTIRTCAISVRNPINLRSHDKDIHMCL